MTEEEREKVKEIKKSNWPNAMCHIKNELQVTFSLWPDSDIILVMSYVCIWYMSYNQT